MRRGIYKIHEQSRLGKLIYPTSLMRLLSIPPPARDGKTSNQPVAPGVISPVSVERCHGLPVFDSVSFLYLRRRY